MILNDTIIAKTTPNGISGVGIIKISGIQTKNIAYKILGTLPKPRYAYYSNFLDNSGSVIDNGIALWFPKPFSFTGEDVLELQGHGNPIILDLLIQVALSINNTRIANPGEFSQRAFLNNKIDLIQAESIIELIHANSENSIKSSINSLNGVFSKKINIFIRDITKIRILIETMINFPEEEVVNNNINYTKFLEKFLLNIKNIITIGNFNKKNYEGVKVVIVGSSNVGKSSIFNSILSENIAIVTNIEGTTRDLICKNLFINGIKVELIDTAGLRFTNNIIEKIGIKKTWKVIKMADYILFVIDNFSCVNYLEINYFISKFSKKIPIVIVFNKSDIYDYNKIIKYYYNYKCIIVSAKTGFGINQIIDYLKKNIINHVIVNTESVFLARTRHINILKKIYKYVNIALKNWVINKNIELLSEDLKLIQNLLNKITGCITSEKILNSIFSKFCIGK